MKQRQIVWSNWIDPLQEEIDETEEEEGYNDSYDDKPSGKVHKLLSTPFGVLPLQPSMLASKDFYFIVLQTNFNLDMPLIQKIEKIDGVETLDIYTRYRARVGIPKSGLFDIEQVKREIEEALIPYPYVENPVINEILVNKFGAELSNNILKHIKQICPKYEYWLLYVIPNGELDLNIFENYQQVKEKIEFYEQVEINVGGHLLVYNDFR